MKKLVAGAVGLLGAMALCGCSPAPGTAAIVNGVPIPDSKVTNWAEGCAASFEVAGAGSHSAAELRLQAVQWVIIDQLGSDYLEAANWQLSDEELHEVVLSSSGGAALLHTEACTEVAYAIARHNTIMMRLGANTDEYLGDPDVQVNPRYGFWDVQSLEPVDSGSLSAHGD